MGQDRKSAFTSARRVLFRARDLFPITWLGVAVLAVGVVVLRFYAFAKLDLVLLVLGYGALGLLGVAAILVFVTSLVVRFRLTLPVRDTRLELETGRYVETGFSLASLRFVPLLTSTSEVVEPRGVETRHEQVGGRLLESIRVSPRGDHPLWVRTLTVGDVFGLVRISVRLTEKHGIRAVPHVGAIRDMPTLRSMASGDAFSHPLGVDEGDRMDIRRYVAGDPARFVHWKAFARTGKLVVRVPERAIAPSRRVVAYFVAGDADEASAGAARAALERRVLGAEFVFGADGSSGAVRTSAEAVDLLVRSAGARATGGAGLSHYLEEADRDGPATVVLFVPSRPGPWLARVLDVARSRRAPMRIVVGVDGLVGGDARPFVARLLTASAPRDGEALATVLEVRALLSAARAEVLVVDRISGRLLAAPGSSAAQLVAIAGRAA